MYFGYPQAHEDDAERAVRAGLDIVASMADLNAELSKQHDVTLSVRVGITTGQVVVGDIVGDGAAEEVAVVGETPNLAARLQGVAEPDQVVVGPKTYRLLGALFEYQDLGRHDLKGMGEPVQAWRVISARDVESRFEAKRSGRALPLVGRQEELGLLVRSWEASKDGHGQVVLVHGEAGIGKSRLLEALREHLASEDYTWIATRCSPYHVNSTLYPVIEYLKRALGWVPEDSNEEKVQKLEVVLREQSLPFAEVMPLYADLLSLSLPQGRYESLALSPQQQREATLDAIVGWLLEKAEQKPMLQVWDDLHWADPTTLELLELYIEQSPTVSVLNVLTYRPEFVVPWSMRSHMTPIALNRLERAEVEAIVGYLAGGKSLPTEVLGHIVSKSDGVPLYVEELTKTILESESLVEQSSEYVLRGSLTDMQIPSTLQDSLMARLDRSPALREVAQVGAVLGREFAYEMLNAIVGIEEPQLRRWLGRLVENELLYQRGRPPRSTYIFKHALIQDAAYQSLLRRTRQSYHEHVAKLLESRFPETAETHPELLAHHYTEAGVAKKAIEYWYQAGELARSRSAHQEAIMHLNKGISVANHLLDAEEQARYELKLQFTLGGAYLQMKGHSASDVEVAFARARELCSQISDAPELVPTLFGLWRAHIVQMTDIEKPREVATQLLRLAGEQSNAVGQVIAHYAVGFTAHAMGESSVARRHLQEGIRFYLVGDRDTAAVYRMGQDPGVACRCYLAMTDWVLGYPDMALEHTQNGLALAEQIDDPFSIAYALVFTSWITQFQGDLAATSENADKAVSLATEKVFPYWIGIGKVMQGWVLATRNPTQTTILDFKDRIGAHRALGTDLFMAHFLCLLAEVALKASQADVCIAALDEAGSLLDQTGERWCEPEVLRLHGVFLVSQGGDCAKAESHFTKALAIAQQRETKSYELRAAVSLARLWLKRDKRHQAHELLAPIYNWFTEGLHTADLNEAEALINDLG
ncbi:AAA family ATPase [Pseudomonadota bacterium]